TVPLSLSPTRPVKRVLIGSPGPRVRAGSRVLKSPPSVTLCKICLSGGAMVAWLFGDVIAVGADELQATRVVSTTQKKALVIPLTNRFRCIHYCSFRCK